MKMLYIKHRSGKIMNNFAISAILAAKELGIDFTLANNMSMAEPGHFEKVCEQYGIRMEVTSRTYLHATDSMEAASVEIMNKMYGAEK